MSKWISVEERLPEEHRLILFIVNHPQYRKASYEARISHGAMMSGLFYGAFESGLPKEYVSHWMELPEPPGEEIK